MNFSPNTRMQNAEVKPAESTGQVQIIRPTVSSRLSDALESIRLSTAPITIILVWFPITVFVNRPVPKFPTIPESVQSSTISVVVHLSVRPPMPMKLSKLCRFLMLIWPSYNLSQRSPWHDRFQQAQLWDCSKLPLWYHRIPQVWLWNCSQRLTWYGMIPWVWLWNWAESIDDEESCGVEETQDNYEVEKEGEGKG